MNSNEKQKNAQFNDNIHPYIVFMDDNEKIYDCYSFYQISKTFDLSNAREIIFGSGYEKIGNEKSGQKKQYEYNIRPYIVYMDDNKKIYERYSFDELSKTFNLPDKYGNLNIAKTDNKSNDINKNVSVPAIKYLMWFAVGFLCAIISLEIFRLFIYIV